MFEQIAKKEKVVLFGELMLRLKSPGKERLLQSPTLEATFGGAEANVAVSLALFGLDATFVTALPDNAISKDALATLRKYFVNTVAVIKNDARMGLYFLETGADARPSKVIYDRENSAFSKTTSDCYDWDKLLDGSRAFHTTGVTFALSAAAAESAFCAMEVAKSRGISISIDLNYRAKLWKYGADAKTVMTKAVKMADTLIANESDIQNALGVTSDNAFFIDKIDPKNPQALHDHYKKLCQKVQSTFPNLKTIAVTLRVATTADINTWSAVMATGGEFFTTRTFDIFDIEERVGAGDAFAAGLIYAKLQNFPNQKALDFATSAGALKHTIKGDFNLVSAEEVEKLTEGKGNGRIER